MSKLPLKEAEKLLSEAFLCQIVCANFTPLRCNGVMAQALLLANHKICNTKHDPIKRENKKKKNTVKQMYIRIHLDE